MSRLNFGAPAAERDINEGLDDYFVESEAFRRVAAGRKTVVLGNRGTGKSAIFKVIAARDRHAGKTVIELAPEDYSYEMLSKVMLQESAGSWAKTGAYTVAWKYLIYLLVMKDLTRKGQRLKTGPARDVYRYLRDHHEDMADNPIGQLISFMKRLEGVKVGNYEASLKTRELDRLYRLEELEPLLPKLDELCSKANVRVFVDELDRGWDASEDAQGFVAGLFQACISINNRHPNLRVTMSLRQELYDSIPTLYEDAQKYRDLIEILAWDEPLLLELSANRIRHSVPGLRGENDEAAWGAVFAETLEYRQTKSFNYMVDRTLYRPREMIQFCTQCVEEKSKMHADLPINYSVVTGAEQNYSEERCRDLASEYRFQYPGLLEVFNVFRGRVYLFDRDEIEELCLRMATGEVKVGNAAVWVADRDPDQLVEILWRVGFLRAQAVGGIKARRRSGSTYLGPHQISNLNLDNLGRFHIHPMFRAYLGTKEPKS
ncbi:MAG TPA: hypothetical protein VK988_19540 [Acidimicrobiales bacterium]|nr:hypothetical protein [Acidimicrobiales bacterium]